MRTSLVFPAAVAAASLALIGCGANSTSDPGQELYQKAGCASCHGGDGGGGAGPALTDLYGSSIDVTDADGNTLEVFADGEYLRESITDPTAKKVVGYNQQMPVANLTDEQVDQLVVLIESWSSEPPDITLATTNPINAE